MHHVLVWVVAALVAVPGARLRMFGSLSASASVQPAGLDRAALRSVSAVCAPQSAKLGPEAPGARPESGMACRMSRGGRHDMAPTPVAAERSHSVCDPAAVRDDLVLDCKIPESGTPADAPYDASARIFGPVSDDMPDADAPFAGCVERSVADDPWLQAGTCLHHPDHVVPADGQ